ncbi:hypothetical protein ACFQHO_37825 [Actinomadura yumaensis]|uniref:hypothetical protein n=1 Tax=Actinomadura TaxID=1988 RepID=UPI00132242D2|nr:hypothetical protein [Actinomadura sp. J1-007]MWK32700.1 hypothetical protein [Actinomadura sp. J1-007]
MLGGLGPRVYFGAAGALGVVLVGVLVLVLVTGSGGGGGAAHAPRAALPPMGRAAATGPSPDSYSSSPSTQAYRTIAARTSDGAPLTEHELFPAEARTITTPDGRARPALRAKRLDRDCAAAVWGAATAGALRQGRCTQAGRATYADTRRGYAVSVTVFNLASAPDSDRVVQAIGDGRGAGFVLPLPAGSAQVDRFGQGYGMARGLAMGHYAVVAWAQRLDGKGDERDETLLSLLIEGGKAPSVLGRAARTSGGS